MINTYHIVHAEPCEHALNDAIRKTEQFGCNGPVTLGIRTSEQLMLVLTRYRSELAELRGRQHPVPASTKAEEV